MNKLISILKDDWKSGTTSFRALLVFSYVGVIALLAAICVLTWLVPVVVAASLFGFLFCAGFLYLCAVVSRLTED